MFTVEFDLEARNEVSEFDDFEGFEDVRGGDGFVLFVLGYFVCAIIRHEYIVICTAGKERT